MPKQPMHQKKRSQRKLANTQKQIKTRNTIPKLLGCCKGNAQKEIYSCTFIHLKKKNRSQINNLTLVWGEQYKEGKLNPKLIEGRNNKDYSENK